jgi:hypothetical protein
MRRLVRVSRLPCSLDRDILTGEAPTPLASMQLDFLPSGCQALIYGCETVKRLLGFPRGH